MLKSVKFWITLAQIPLAWDWLKAGWDKFSEGGLGGAEFVHGLPTTLGRFAQQKTATGELITNPHTWYTETFLAWAKANPDMFGYMVVYGELGLGILLFAAIGYYLATRKQLPVALVWLVVAGLVGGFIMNFNFYFASGWPESAVSGRSLNIMMMLSELIFIGYYVFAARNDESK